MRAVLRISFFFILMVISRNLLACDGACRVWQNELVKITDDQNYYSSLLEKNKAIAKKTAEGSSMKMKIDSNIYILATQLEGIEERILQLKKDIAEKCGECER